MKTFIVLNLCLTSVLALDKAHHQHMSLRKKHRDEPDVSMSPMEATVKEGTIFFLFFSRDPNTTHTLTQTLIQPSKQVAEHLLL